MTSIHSTSFASHAVTSFFPSPSSSSSNMPIANDWKISPWTDIAEIHAKIDDNEWEKRVAEFFEARLASEDAVASLPSLNSTQVHELCDGQVVRFRCMIQDMFDPEFYVKTFRYRYICCAVDEKLKVDFFRSCFVSLCVHFVHENEAESKGDDRNCTLKYRH